MVPEIMHFGLRRGPLDVGDTMANWRDIARTVTITHDAVFYTVAPKEVPAEMKLTILKRRHQPEPLPGPCCNDKRPSSGALCSGEPGHRGNHQRDGEFWFNKGMDLKVDANGQLEISKDFDYADIERRIFAALSPEPITWEKLQQHMTEFKARAKETGVPIMTGLQEDNLVRQQFKQSQDRARAKQISFGSQLPTGPVEPSMETLSDDGRRKSRWKPLDGKVTDVQADRIDALEKEVKALRGNEVCLQEEIGRVRACVERRDMTTNSVHPFLQGRAGYDFVGRLFALEEKVKTFLAPLGAFEALRMDVTLFGMRDRLRNSLTKRKAFDNTLKDQLAGEHAGETVMQWADRTGVGTTTLGKSQ